MTEYPCSCVFCDGRNRLGIQRHGDEWNFYIVSEYEDTEANVTLTNEQVESLKGALS